MIKNKTISIVIPAYKVSKHISEVLNSVPGFIDHVIVVDDNCPDFSGRIAQSQEYSNIPHLEVLLHAKNTGVGGAVVSGYKKALELGSDVVIKVDGDGQMDLNYLPQLISPIINESVDYAKGNRFNDFRALRAMPRVRLFGNSVLSFAVKLVSGNWHVMDPTNGFTAINKFALQRVDLDSLSERYFFESDMLINLNIHRCSIKDVPIPAKYGDEESSLSISRTLVEFPKYLFKGFLKRIFLKYFIYDFNMGSVYLLAGIPLVLWGILFGLYQWWWHSQQGLFTPTGTVMLSVLPLIIGTQFLLQAVQIDISSTPKR